MNSPNPDLDQKKMVLLQKSKEYEDKINLEVDSIKDKAKDIGKYALVAGGIAVLGVILVKFVYNIIVPEEEPEYTSSDRQIIHLPVENQSSLVPVYREPKEQSLIVKMIISAIATFLLSIAKQKLTQFIEQLYAKEADKDSSPAAQ